MKPTSPFYLILMAALFLNGSAFKLSGQNQIYLLGQLVSNSATYQVPEAIQLHTSTPVIQLKKMSGSPMYAEKLYYTNEASKLSISSMAPNATTRHMSAAITSGNLPAHSRLILTVLHPGANFSGYAGNINSSIDLDKAEKTLVTDIGTCRSGKTDYDGYGLAYTLETDPGKVNTASLKNKTITITYTVTADV